MFESIMSSSLYLIDTLIYNFGLTLEDLAGKEEIFEELVLKAKSAGLKLYVEQKSTGTYNHTEIDRAFKNELVRLIKAA